MRTIYEPEGRAKEFSELALNLYNCCNLGCTYCFNRKTPWYKPQEKCLPRTDILEELDKQAAKMAGDSREILLCFTSDPYPMIPKIRSVTREALLIMEKYHLKAQILTKAGERSVVDFDILVRNNLKYGVSMTCVSEETRLEYEPFTAKYEGRKNALSFAKSMGIQTWVSLEPVLRTEETLWIIQDLLLRKRTQPDVWKLGRWNYDIEANKIDWKMYLADARHLLDEAGQKYMVKQDLLEAAGC
jgi:DNA repair photolyase